MQQKPEPEEPKPKKPEPQKQAEDVGIINKIVYAIFGPVKVERGNKWSEPWQSHPEFQKKKEKREEEKTVVKKVDTSPGIIHKFVSLIFGEPHGKRDAKWAQPWQTHPEHKKKKEPLAQEPEKPKKVDTSPGIIHKFVSLIFGEPTGKRDEKWAQPWQTHPEHKREAKQPKVQKEKEKEEKVIYGATGGPLDKLVKLVFPTAKEGTVRDPKWAKPWQTHPEFANKGAPKEDKPKEKEVKKEKIGASGGPIDKLVKLIFTDIVPEGTERDPKWSKPWQTHPEFANKAAPKEAKPKEKEEKVKVVGPSGGLIDKFVKLIFTDVLPEGTKRAPKWSQPWQTHPEHASKSAQKEKPKEPKETKKEVAGASGGPIDWLVKLIFETTKEGTPRDPKWAQPWQTHKEHMKDAKLKPKPEAVTPPPPPKKPEPVTPPAPKEPEPAPAPKKPEPEPVPKAEPEPAKKPAPVEKPAPAPAPAKAPEPEPKPAAKAEAFPGEYSDVRDLCVSLCVCLSI